MSTSGEARWLTITQVSRLTGLSDETIRKYCVAKVHFPSRGAEGEDGHG